MMGDLIERQKAIDAIYHHKPSMSQEEVRQMLHEVPSAQTEPCNLPQLGATYEDGDKLDEAIRLEERAAEAYSEAHNQFHDNVDPSDAECCLNRAARHRQLASWLRELKRMRAQGTCDDAVSREAVYNAMVEKGQHSRRYKLGEKWELNGGEIREALYTVPSVTPKLAECEDAVSREDVLKIVSTYSVDAENANQAHMADMLFDEIANMPPTAQKSTECEDAVSREAAIDAALSAFSRGLLASPDIRKLPSVTPTRTGKWIDDNCSECGFYVYHGDMRNFCPNCGAKMNGGNQNE